MSSSTEINVSEMEAESSNMDSLEVISSIGYNQELEIAAMILTRVELDLACSSEKLVNLDILVMHVAERENDFDVFALGKEESLLNGTVEKALEFDLLYGILDSEVREIESHLIRLGTEVKDSRGVMLSFSYLGDSLREMEDKLQDCEETLKRSFEQVSDLKEQSDGFKRILLSSCGDEQWKTEKDTGVEENRDMSDSNAKIKMETAEQQRHVLRMLEKALAKEMELEKKLAESRQTEEDLNIKLQQDILCKEEEAEHVLERLFEAENKAEIMSGVMEGLVNQIQMEQTNVKESSNREEEMKLEIQELTENLKEKERRGVELVAKVNLFEEKLKELERVEELEKQLKDSEVRRLHAEAKYEASQEKQNMLDFTIRDMDKLIVDLKLKASKAEIQTDSAEDKCIFLSESNAALMEQMSFLKGRVKSLETCLRQTDEAKKKTAKDIKVQTQLIGDLIMQLALERERLHKQISSLIEEKKATGNYLQHIRKEPPVTETTGNEPINSLANETKTVNAEAKAEAEANTVRNIDARQLTFKNILVAVVLLAIPALGAVLFQQ